MSIERPASYNGEPFVLPHFTNVRSEQAADYFTCASTVDRTYDEYCKGFGFPIADLYQGKRVLDLGSGTKATFARQARELGAQVVSLNPNWRIDPDMANHPDYNTWPGDGLSVAAIAQELPFQDKSFDLILSLWGVPTYLPGTKGEYVRAYREMDRVLADDGIAIMHPIGRVALKQPAFREALEESFDTYEILENGWLPKIFVEKNISPDEREFADTLKAVVDRPTEIFLI